MGTLDAAARKHIDSSKFGLPASKGEPAKYPMPDAAHARDAKARAAEEYNKGDLTKAQEERIDRMADRILHKGDRPNDGTSAASKRA